MLIKDYSLLPDYMDLGDISDKIEEILVFSSHNKTSTVDVAQALLEMIHRQGENYSERFSDDVILKIKKWIIDFWDFSSWDLFKITSAIIVNLDFYYFPEGFKLLESALP